MTNSSSERLGQIRRQLDQIDGELLKLLNERASLSREVGRIKEADDSQIFRPLREHELLGKLAEQNSGELPEEHMTAIWREILSSSRALQQPQHVAYLGPEGTFSYFAALEYLGHSAKFHPCRDITEIFEKVAGKSCNLGLVPLENSLHGTVGISVDLFLKNDVVIVAELYSRISNCLLSREKQLAGIKKIYSHPQPFGQCGAWLRANLPNAVLLPVNSTAEAAQLAAGEAQTAALGNMRLAQMYNLDILASQVEDNKNNWTRFVVIAPAHQRDNHKNSVGADKTSLVFIVPDKPGSLARVLDLMGRNGLNMRKLESRPQQDKPWQYVFFADIENNLQDDKYAAVLDELNESCITFRILGSYASGPKLDHALEINS